MSNTRVITGGVRGKDFLTITVPIKAGETFQEGDFLIWSTTGASKTGTTGADQIAGTTVNTWLLGRAESPAVNPNDNTINPYVTVTACRPGTQFLLPLYSATAASAVTNQAQLGKNYRLFWQTGSTAFAVFPMVDLDNSGADTQNFVRVVDFNPDDFPAWPSGVGPGTVQYATVWVEMLSSLCLLTGARVAA